MKNIIPYQSEYLPIPFTTSFSRFFQLIYILSSHLCVSLCEEKMIDLFKRNVELLVSLYCVPVIASQSDDSVLKIVSFCACLFIPLKESLRNFKFTDSSSSIIIFCPKPSPVSCFLTVYGSEGKGEQGQSAIIVRVCWAVAPGRPSGWVPL